MIKRIALTTLLALTVQAASTYALNVNGSAVDLEIEFAEAKRHSDVETDFGSGEKAFAAISKSITAAFRESANKYLPKGYTLQVEVENIDLAGDRSPLTSPFGEYRVYDDAFPPRIRFTYAVYDPQERLVKRGSASESDLSYTFHFRATRHFAEEEAPYVADLVRGWASQELRRAATNQ